MKLKDEEEHKFRTKILKRNCGPLRVLALEWKKIVF